MTVTLSTQVEDDYVIIRVEGKIDDAADFNQIALSIHDELKKKSVKKGIFDERELEYTRSVSDWVKTIEFISGDLPIEARNFRLAVVLNKKHKEESGFWENYIVNRGYNVKQFFSMNDAIEYIKK